MKNKFLKKAYVSIEVVIVAAVILTAGLCGLLAFVKNAKERNNGMLNAIDDIYAELDKPISGTGGGAGGIGGDGNIVIRPYSANLVTGFEFNASVPEGTTDIVFTDVVAPEGAELTDLSVEQNGSIVAWLDGTTYYVSSQDEMTSISFNENCECMFFPYWEYYIEEEDYWDETNMPCLNSIEFNNASTSKVKNMDSMFACQCYLSHLDLTTFDVSNVENMGWMFECMGCEETDLTINISGWDTSNVTDMGGMFGSCGSWEYNVNIIGLETMNTSNVVYMYEMFTWSTITELDLTNWDTRNAESMDGMFYMGLLEKVTFGENWTWATNEDEWPYLIPPSESALTGTTDYWYDKAGNQYLPEEIPNGAGTYYAYPHRCEDKDSNGSCDGCGKHVHLDKNKDDYCDACNEYLMAGEAYAIYTDADKTLRFIRSETAPVVGGDYEGLEIAAVYSDFETGTYNYEAYTGTGETPWVVDYQYRYDIQNVIFVDYIRPIDTSGWFSLQNCSNFDVSKLDTSRTTDMSYTFADAGYNAEKLYVDLSNWDVSNVTNMRYMFGCMGYEATRFELIGLSNWDVSNVVNMGWIFYETGFRATTWSVSDLSQWNVTNVTVMDYAFAEAGDSSTSWFAGDLSNWNVSNLENAFCMFYFAFSNSSVWPIGDLSKWDVSGVTDMYGMFEGAGYNVDYTLDLSAWKEKIENVADHTNFDKRVESKIISPWD